MKKLDDEHFGCSPLCLIFSFAVIMSEIHSTDHKSITARHCSFPDEGFREAGSEFVESEKDYTRFEAEFSRVYELNKQQDRVHNIWCLDPVNRKDFFERIQNHQAIHSTPLNFLQLPFRIRKPCLG